jgi:hypothetical protein
MSTLNKFGSPYSYNQLKEYFRKYGKLNEEDILQKPTPQLIDQDDIIRRLESLENRTKGLMFISFNTIRDDDDKSTPNKSKYYFHKFTNERTNFNWPIDATVKFVDTHESSIVVLLNTSPTEYIRINELVNHEIKKGTLLWIYSTDKNIPRANINLIIEYKINNK